MILNQQGRRRSLRSQRERELMLQVDMTSLSADELCLLQAMLADEDEEFDLHAMTKRARYVREPVSMEQFIEDPYYLGESLGGGKLYPRLKQDMIEMGTEGEYREAIFTGSIGYGKCLHGDSEMYDPVRGRITAREAAGLRDIHVCAWTGGGVEQRKSSAVMSGSKLVGTLVLSSGRRLRVSPDHPVLTADGYVAAGELGAGRHVATPRSIPAPCEPLDISDAELRFMTYMFMEGSCSSGNWDFTTGSPEQLEDFTMAAMALTGDRTDRPVVTLKGRSGNAATYTPHGTRWLQRKYDLHCLAVEKRVPASFYLLSQEQLGLFLNLVWATDGSVYSGSIKKLELELGSEYFVRDVQHLLLRFGVQSRVYKRRVSYTYKGEKRWSTAWRLMVYGADNISVFFGAVGQIFTKEEKSREVMAWADGTTGNTNTDVVPISGRDLRAIRKKNGPITREQWWPGLLNKSYLGMGGFVQLCDTYSFMDEHRWMASLFWDRVVSWECGEQPEPVYDVEVPGPENAVVDGVVVHNTTVGSALIVRVLYELSCLHSPQDAYSMSRGSEMVIVLLSRNLPLARTVLKSAVEDKIKLSPYFREHFKPKFGRDVTKFPKNIMMSIASCYSERVLGMNVFAGIMDESNFMATRGEVITATGGKKTVANFDLAEKVYASISRRIKSRYLRAGGDLPGVMVLLSSSTTHGSFLSRRMDDSKNDPHVFVRDYALWHVKPADHYSGDTFKVAVGTSSLRSRILDGGIIPPEYACAEDITLIDVPLEYKPDFERDLENALRDIAGVSTEAISPFIHRKSMIKLAVNGAEHPFTVESWIYGHPGEFRWDLLSKRYTRLRKDGTEEFYYLPKLNPRAQRWVHVDPALSGDALGIAMGHIARWVEVVRRAANGEPYQDTAPYVIIDFMLQVLPPFGEQIFLPDIRRMVYELMAHGFSLSGYSADSYQSAETMQQIARKGVRTKLVSVDRTTEPYDKLKSALYEQRIEFYGYPVFLREFGALEYDRVKQKVDHPAAGTKDVSDAVAGVMEGLITSHSRMPVVMPTTVGDFGDDEFEQSWVARGIPVRNEEHAQTIASAVRAKRDATVPLPFLMG